jgi:hypothetical protein
MTEPEAPNPPAADAPPPLSRGKRLLFTAVPLVGLLILLEIVLRFANPRLWLEGQDFYEHRWAVRQAARAGRPADQTRPDYGWDMHDPDLGWVSRPNFRSAEVNTNSDGLRGLRDYPRPKPLGEGRIVAVGDSYCFAEEVGDEEGFCRQLELRLGVGVVNLGTHGYAHDQQLLSLRKRGFAYEPDLVLFAFNLPDIERNPLAFRDFAKPRFRLEPDGRLILEGGPLPTPEEAVVRPAPWWYPRVWGFVRTQASVLGRWALGPKGADDPDVRLALAISDALVDDCSARGVKVIVLLIAPSVTADASPEETAVLDWAARRGLTVVNMRPRFWELPDEVRRTIHTNGGRGHWTALGHKMAAEALAEAIRKERLLP